ncbi:MAG: thioredoxin family protein [Candidatus Marinimicrobia bacterium]|nr:thioredoxin family protein [Candidatus Neomarinimicrobiota bacterium]|tara:strand:- start:203 stop:787 length:585 start_codon:yes stop_codon:yes gene_type:complete
MKKIIFYFIFSVFALGAELKIGRIMPEPEHVLNDISGKQITLSDIKGNKGTLVIFSCNTCPWVIRWEDRYVSLAESYIKEGIGIIAVNSNVARFDGDDSLNKMRKHAKDNNYIFPYAQDPGAKLAYAFGATKTPHIYLFDNKNKLVYRGAIDDNARNASDVEEPYLENALDQLLAGEKIKKTTSKAIGCSIKFP